MHGLAEEEMPETVGLDKVLSQLISRALRSTQDIESVALGDPHGLPIIDATSGRHSVMTFTAMSTMTIQAATTAAQAVGLQPPEHICVQAVNGQLVIMNLPESRASLIALLREGANLGMALFVLRDLARQLDEALGKQ